jgi:hypothetical protein
VTAGDPYDFTPIANDADGDVLSYDVVSLPGWAEFDTATGHLWGTPDVNEVALYAGIVITVSDGSESASLSAFDIEVVGTATGAATLSWTIPTLNEDDSPLDGDLAGFRIYYSMAAGDYTESRFKDIATPGLATGMVENLSPATWFFVVTAYDFSGNESAFSNEASKMIDEVI